MKLIDLRIVHKYAQMVKVKYENNEQELTIKRNQMEIIHDQKFIIHRFKADKILQIKRFVNFTT